MTQCTAVTQKIHISVLDASVDVDHKANLESHVFSLVDGKCGFIRGRELFQGVFFVVRPFHVQK